MTRWHTTCGIATPTLTVLAFLWMPSRAGIGAEETAPSPKSPPKAEAHDHAHHAGGAAHSEVHGVHGDKGDAHGGPHADPHADSHADSHAGHGHGEHTIHGKPPVGPLGKGSEFLFVDPRLLIWTLIVFLPTAFLLRKFAWEPLLAAIEHRDHEMKESLRLAEEARQEAQRLLAHHDEEMAKAHDKARALLEASRAEAAKQTEVILSEARSRSAEALEQSAQRIEEAKQSALAELSRSAEQLAGSMAGKVLGRPVDSASYRSAFEETAT